MELYHVGNRGIQWRTIWMEEAMHRAANLQHIASNLERLLYNGRIDSSNRLRTIRRANALVSAYQSLDVPLELGPRS
jgi:hypothetical protein